MNRVAAAPCQCSSPGSKNTRSPGRITSTGPPRRWRVADALEDEDRLAVRVRVPRGARARREVHAARAHARGARRRRDRVDVDRAREPVARPRPGLNAASRDLHRSSPLARVSPSSSRGGSAPPRTSSRLRRCRRTSSGPASPTSVIVSNVSVEVADDWMVEPLAAGVVVAHVVRGPPRAEAARSCRQLADEIRELAVVRIPAGLGAQDGDGIGRDLVPVEVEAARARSRKTKRAVFGGRARLGEHARE